MDKGRWGLHLEALSVLSLSRNIIIRNSVLSISTKESKGDVSNFSKAASQFRIKFNRAVLGVS